MALLGRRFLLSLALVGVLLSVFLTPQAALADGKSLSDAALAKAAKMTGKNAGKLPMKDLYNNFIRNGLLPKLRSFFRRADQQLGQSWKHQLARAWHTLFTYHMSSLDIPESWGRSAAEVYVKLGGHGELELALQQLQGKNRTINLSKGALKEEFISYAMFYLGAFVPEKIEECPYKSGHTALKCIAAYEEQLEMALRSTLVSFFQYVIPRGPSSQIVPTAFVVSTVSPCPFGFLLEPSLIYGILTNINSDYFKPLASVKRVLKGKACPKLRKSLLHVLMLNGITPSDVMHSKEMNDDLLKIANTIGNAVEHAADAIMEAGTVQQPNLLKTEGADLEAAADALLEKLRSFVKTTSKDGQALSDLAKKHLAPENEQVNFGYLDRVQKFFDGKADEELVASSLRDLMKEFSLDLHEEYRRNPQMAPMKPIKADSIHEEAKEVLKNIRNFGLQVSKFMPVKAEKEKDDE